jgi:hypothetical protein
MNGAMQPALPPPGGKRAVVAPVHGQQRVSPEEARMNDPQAGDGPAGCNADMIHSAETVAAAVSRVAREISARLRDSKPVAACA